MIKKLDRDSMTMGGVAYWSITILFLFGVLFPSSINGVINVIPIYVAPIVTFTVLVTIILMYKKINIMSLVSVLAMNTIVWLATLLNPGERVRNIGGGTYILLSLLFLTNLKSIPIRKSIKTIFSVVNILLIIIGLAMINYNQFVYNLFINYYSDFYRDLVPNMLDRGKPILTFGTHSIAAFYIFLFFYLNIRTYAILNKRIYLLSSIAYLYLCFALKSNSGYLFFLFGILVLILNLKLKIRTLAIVSLAILAFMITKPIETQAFFDTIEMNIESVTSSKKNGITGRYSEMGNQTVNLRHILDKPFSPTGLSVTFGSDLTYHDSGLTATTLEGTIILTLLVHGLLFYFLRKNISNKKSALTIFLALMLMQMGYNNLFYYRTLCILPFVILYLNSLEENILNVSSINKKEIKMTLNSDKLNTNPV